MAEHAPPAPISLDPLIAEARTRARQRRLVAALVFALALAAATAWLGLRSTGAPGVSGASSRVPRPMVWIGGGSGVGWAVDSHYLFWLTRDGGRTWQYNFRRTGKVGSPNVVSDVGQVQFVDQQHGWITALLDGFSPTYQTDPRPWAIERTVDGGRTWRISWLPGCGCAGGEMSFYDARHGYVLTDDLRGANPRLFWTEDGGASWKLVAHLSHRLGSSLTFINRRDGFLGENPGSTGGLGMGLHTPIPGFLYRTTDGGKTWSKLRVPPSSLGLQLPIRAFGQRLVVTDGKERTQPKIYASNDGGAHWKASVPPHAARTSNIDFVSPTLWAFATGTRLYVTHDGGHRWDTIVPRGLPRNRYDGQLAFASPRVGWMVVDQALYRTADGGRHWTLSACGRAHLACPAGG